MRTISSSPRNRSSKGAFSLIEVTLALGVAGFCLISVFGLLPLGLASNQVSLNQTVAANITSAIQSDLNCAQPLGSGTTPHFGFSIPAAGATNTLETIYLTADGIATQLGAIPTTTGTAVSRYRATLWFSSPATIGQRTATAVRILITWPALADSAPASIPQYYIGSYEADTTLNRN
jgi:type II secretory pathway pseudopilin PulG